jgi:PAS domain S-box-containing protein
MSPEHTATATIPMPAGRARLLIVEDEAIVARDLQGRLKRLGYEVCAIVASGAGAIEAASQHRPDLVLMDIVLKGDMDGIEAAEVISRDYEIPTVFLTAYADQQTLQRAKLAVPLGYIVKPFTERELGIMLEINLYRAAAEARLRQSMAALRVSEARFRTVIDTAQEGILLVDDEGLVQILNPAARRMFGWGDEVIGEAVDRLIGSGDQHAAGSFAANLSKFSGVSHEVEGRRKDGTTFPMDLTVGEASQLGHRLFVSIARDISERKQAEKTQRVLIDELNHRVKNTLATVQAFAAQTLSRAKDPVHFMESFTGRIQALASAHTLLTRTTWTGAELGTLIRAQLAAGCDVEGDRLVCSGPEVILDPQLAVHLGLSLHELCINAVKYGALSLPEGRLTVSWTLVKSETSTELKLDWIESGGPPVAPPASRGFGTVLVEHGLTHIGARVKLGFPATGVVCEIVLPITERSRPASDGQQDD